MLSPLCARSSSGGDCKVSLLNSSTRSSVKNAFGLGPSIDSGTPIIQLLFLQLLLSRSYILASSLSVLSAKAAHLNSNARICWSFHWLLSSNETMRWLCSCNVGCIFSSPDSMAANVFLKSVAMFALCSSSKLVMLARQVLLQAPDVSVLFFFGCFVNLDTQKIA